jgi:hypothetical protein
MEYQSTPNSQFPTPETQPNQYSRLASTDEVDDLYPIAVADDHVVETLALEDRQVMLDGHAARIDVKLRQQGDDGQRLVQFETFAVECNDQGMNACSVARVSWTRRMSQRTARDLAKSR